MRRSLRSLGVRCALLLSTASLVMAQSGASPRQALATSVATPADAALIGRLPASQQLHVAVSLPLRNQEQLHTLLQQLYDPSSPNYRQFLTVQQFTEQFGPSVVDYQRVIGFAQAHGLKIEHTFVNRMIVDVAGPSANIEQAFQVRMQLYHHPTENRTFYAPDVEPTVEAGLPILSVDGLSSFEQPHSMLKHALPGAGVHANTTGSGSGGQFLGSDMRAAYGGGTALNGTGQVVGLIELGPYRLTDVLSYFNSIGQPLNVPIVNVVLSADGICSNTEPPPGPCDDGEEVIDIQQAISMAPNLSALIVYEAYSSSVSALDAYNQAASDNLAKALSISFGWGGTPNSEISYEQVFEELVTQGVTSFVASGDAGANVGSGGYPGNSQNITDAGGTDLTTNGAGGSWLSESGWIGSGGGWNTQSSIPGYQTSAINSTNGGDPSYRNIPDVAAEANTDNYFCANGSCQGGIGGTSLAAPRWAGMIALINQQAVANATSTSNPTVGFLNPTIYTGNYTSGFHDITTGTNATTTSCTVGTLGCLSNGVQGFDAVTGFDLVTGWGSPNGPAIFNALAPPSTNANFSITATPSVLPLTTAGNGGTSSIAVTALNGFSATTTLSVMIPGSPSSAPPGLTASLSASSIASGGGPVTLTIGTTSATPGGTYVIAVVGSTGAGLLTQTAYVTVELPAFVGLTATPAAGVSLPQNGTAAATVTITGINGFSGTVNLSASGLPGGVTASFNSINSTTSTATFTASSTAALTGPNKPTTVTITGTATGSTSQTTGVNLFVNPPASGGAGTAVDLSSAYNLHAFYDDSDESTITASNSLDGVGFVYSANLLGAGVDFNGAQFNFGPANQADAVYGTGTAIALPAGFFGSLQLLATGIQGNQASQTITVTYTDNSTSQFTQSFSDWCSGLNGGGCTSTGSNSGESVAIAMPYRDSAGGADNRVFYLYGYSFALNSSKTVQSVTLPSNRNVVVLAASLMPPPPTYSISAPAATTPTSVNAGQSATAAVSLTPANGYSGSVTLSCSISPVVTGGGAPTCSFSANPVSVSGGVATATLTFSTVAPTTKIVHTVNRASISNPHKTDRSQGLPYASLIALPGLALIFAGFGSRGSRRRALLGASLFCIMVASLILLPACGGGSSGGGSGGGCATVPSVPTGLAASSTTSSGTTLNWSASTAASGCSVTGYNVYENGSSIATATNPTYNVTGLSASTQYSFSVAATDSAGASAQSTAINVTSLSNGTPSGTYTITITGKDANGVAQTGSGATVTAVVN